MTLDRLARRLPVFRIRHLPPRHRDDAAGTDDLTGTVAQEQGRQQLAVGEVAGADEDVQPERIDGNSLRGHLSPPGSASRRSGSLPARHGPLSQSRPPHDQSSILYALPLFPWNTVTSISPARLTSSFTATLPHCSLRRHLRVAT